MQMYVVVGDHKEMDWDVSMPVITPALAGSMNDILANVIEPLQGSGEEFRVIVPRVSRGVIHIQSAAAD